MKLKYLYSALIAAMSLTLASSCDNPNDEATLLAEVQVSESYISLPTTGETCTATFEVNASADWTATVSADWLTVAPLSGAAGKQTITLSAAASEGRTAEVAITAGGKTQYINVIQGIATVSSVSCAECLAGPDSKNYQIKGTVTKIVNTTYGNWYINDGTGEVYIYGTLDKTGAEKNFLSLGLEVGDIVTVQGPKTTYNGVVELVNVTVVKIEKSLIKVEEVTETAFTSDGGEFTATLDNKGENLFVEIPEAAQEWLSISGVAGNNVTFKVAPNTAGPRVATIVFKTQSNGKDYSSELSISQDGLSGTLEVPFTVAEAIAYCNKLGGDSPKEFYVKGIVTKIQSAYNANYGNGTFWISDDGTHSVAENGKSTADTAHDFEVYRALWLGNQKWTDDNKALSEGDEVVICGTLTLYNGIAETASGKSYVYSVNGCTTDVNGLGSLNAPFNAAGAYAAASNGVTSNVYVAGKISKVLYTFSATYGTATFWLSTDGTFNGAENAKSTTDYEHDFECYGVYYFNNTPWTDGCTQVAEGDDAVIYGAITLYNGMAETSNKKAWIYSLNGVTGTEE